MVCNGYLISFDTPYGLLRTNGVEVGVENFSTI
jgi:hypothetical protein